MSDQDTRVTMQYVNEAASGGTVSLPPMPNPFTDAGVPSARVVDFDFVPDALLAEDATNYMSVVARDLADSENLSTAITNSTGALAAGTSASGLPMIAASDLDVASGSSVFAKKTEGGTGGLLKGWLVWTWKANRYSV
jgi:hypothetical protein